jgi:SAM-dependent methyltransferase
MGKWYANWFDSPYYHILYKNRDFTEAERFIKNLLDFMKPKPFYQMVDMACGKGRHAKLLADAGFDTIGLDLSPQSIESAKQYEKCNLHFFEHNMLQSPDFHFKNADIIFNLFTSFGYFDDVETHGKIIKSFSNCLAPGGWMVFDFMNAQKVINNLVKEETKLIDGISFGIKRYVENGKIFKEISFSDQGEDYFFREEVFGLTQDDFKKMFLDAGLQINHQFGDYDLNPFDIENSSRLIIIAQK